MSQNLPTGKFVDIEFNNQVILLKSTILQKMIINFDNNKRVLYNTHQKRGKN